MASFYSNGKLLITGEYLVLDGAKALALPTKYGQHLEVKKIDEPKLIWESYSDSNDRWLQVEFDLPRLRIISETFDSELDGGNDTLALNLQNILFEAKKLNSEFLSNEQGFYVKSKLTFARNWGLGSSSTLINNVAQWAKIDAFKLQFDTFGGSAYDIACAQNNTPIVYQIKDKNPLIKEAINFDPSFKQQLYFVHLNVKQNSREGITHYQNFNQNVNIFLEEISKLTSAFINCDALYDFEKLMEEHEQLISSIIKQKPIQQELFSDYFGQTKSLGAWGGDFILATGNEETSDYFKSKGYSTIISFQDMVL